MKLGFSNLIRVYVGELDEFDSEIKQYPLSQDNILKDNSTDVVNSEDFIVTFSDQNTFIEFAPSYELIDPNRPTRVNREERNGLE